MLTGVIVGLVIAAWLGAPVLPLLIISCTFQYLIAWWQTGQRILLLSGIYIGCMGSMVLMLPAVIGDDPNVLKQIGMAENLAGLISVIGLFHASIKGFIGPTSDETSESVANS